MPSLIFDKPQEAKEKLAEWEERGVVSSMYHIHGHFVHVASESVFFVCSNFIVLCLPAHPLAHEGSYFIVNGRSGASELQHFLLVAAMEDAIEINDMTITLYRKLTEDPNEATRKEILDETTEVH